MNWVIGKKKRIFKDGESVRLPIGAYIPCTNPMRCVCGKLQIIGDNHLTMLTEHDGKIGCTTQGLTHIKKQIYSPCELCIHREADYCSDICSKCHRTGYKPITEESHEL